MEQERRETTKEDIDTMVTLACLNGAQKGIRVEPEEIRVHIASHYELKKYELYP